MLILDQSSSLITGQNNYDNWNVYMIGFASAIVQAFPISPNLTLIGLMKYSNDPVIVFHLYNFTETKSILEALQKVDIDGGDTNTAGALQAVRTKMFAKKSRARADVRRLVFLVTDGTANVEADRTQTEAQLTRDAGIEIFTVGVTNKVDKRELKMIASYPSERHFYYVSEFHMLHSVVRNLTENACLPPITTTTRFTTPTTTTSTTTTTTTTPVPTTTPPGKLKSIVVGKYTVGRSLFNPIQSIYLYQAKPIGIIKKKHKETQKKHTNTHKT